MSKWLTPYFQIFALVYPAAIVSQHFIPNHNAVPLT